MTASARSAAVLALALAVAAALTVTGTRLAGSATTTITALRTSETVPLRDPFDAFWDEVPRVEIPLSAQQIVPPKGGRGFTMGARAVHDGENLYIAVDWADASADRSVDAPQDFTDAVAVQFPAVPGQAVPAFCMGDPNATVNIWQWKAAWQADVRRGFQGGIRTRYPNAEVDLYPFRGEEVFYPGRAVGNPFSAIDRTTPVDNLVAGGFGTLTADPEPLVDGWGAWRNGGWRVVFSRPMQVGREGSVELGVGVTDMAFAVWDGAAEERDGMKSVANFVTLHIADEAEAERPGWPAWPLPFIAFLTVWALVVVMVAGRLGGKGTA